jgi:hypothetical protein
MKRAILYSILFLISIGIYGQRAGVIASSQGTTSSTLLSGLVPYWKFDDANGNAVDSNAGLTGVITDGTPTYSVTGKVGTAITFNGAAHFLVGTTTALRLPQITISFTFKTTTSSYFGLVTNTWDDGTNFYGFSITTELNHVRARGFKGDTEIPYVEGTTDITTGEWFHVAFTSDGTNLKLYINGTQEGGDVSFPNSLIYDGNCNFDIGARNNGGIPFTGTMDEVKVWNRALTQSEITQDYGNVTNGITLL